MALITLDSSFDLLQFDLANWPCGQAIVEDGVLELDGFSWSISGLAQRFEGLVWVLAILELVHESACFFFRFSSLSFLFSQSYLLFTFLSIFISLLK